MAKKRPPKKPKERHKLAMTTVEVYRLFKVRDAGRVLRASSDHVISALGTQITMEATSMLAKYVDEQNRIIEKGGKDVDLDRYPVDDE
jgi:hypothetical protein